MCLKRWIKADWNSDDCSSGHIKTGFYKEIKDGMIDFAGEPSAAVAAVAALPVISGSVSVQNVTANFKQA